MSFELFRHQGWSASVIDYTAADRLGDLCARQGRVDEAVHWYRKINELAPRNEFADQKIFDLIGKWR